MKLFGFVLVLVIVGVGPTFASQKSTPTPVPTVQPTTLTTDTEIPDELVAADAEVEALREDFDIEQLSPEDADYATWQTITGENVTMMLPEYFTGGDYSDEFLIDLAESVPEVEDFIDQYRAQIDTLDFTLLALDTTNLIFQTNVNIIRTEFTGMGSDELTLLSSLLPAQLPEILEVVSNELVPYQGDTALRLELESTMVGQDLRQLQYYVSVDDSLWIITYSTSEESFDSKLPIFEVSVRTFAVTS